MLVYGEVSVEVLDNINKYIKKGEKVKISIPIEYCEKQYRKVVFFKSNFYSKEEEFLYINDKNKVVDNAQIQKELTKLFYYFDIFYDENNKMSIYKIIQTDSDIKRDENDYIDAEKGLKIMLDKLKKQDEINGMRNVMAVVKQVPELRKKNGEKINEVVNLINDMKKKNQIFNEEVLNEIYTIYKEALIINFKKIKIIYPCGQYYNKFKKLAEKTRMIFSLTFRTRNITYLVKANYVMGYFDKILRTYSKILDMNENQYKKFLKQAENNNVNEKLKLIRNR